MRGRQQERETAGEVPGPVAGVQHELNSDFAAWAGYPAPYVRTCVSDGFWLMLHPLGVGSHVIHFAADNPTTRFSLDVTYNITVAP
jgi:hypothetical protein